MPVCTSCTYTHVYTLLMEAIEEHVSDNLSCFTYNLLLILALTMLPIYPSSSTTFKLRVVFHPWRPLATHGNPVSLS